MTFKKIMLVTLFLLAILTLGAVSAAEDGISDSLAVDDNVDDNISSVADDKLLVEDDYDDYDDYGDDDDYDDDDDIFMDSPVYMKMPSDDKNGYENRFDNVTVLKGDESNNFVLKIDDTQNSELHYNLIVDNETRISINNDYDNYEYIFNVSSLDFGYHTWKLDYSYLDDNGDTMENSYNGSFILSYYKFVPLDEEITNDYNEISVDFYDDVQGRLLVYLERKLVFNETVKYDGSNSYYPDFYGKIKLGHTYKYTVIFESGDETKYPGFTKTGSFLYTYPFSITLDDIEDGIRYGSNITGTIDLPSETYGNNATVVLNGKTYKFAVGEDGRIIFSLDNLVFGNNTIEVSYEDSTHHRKTITQDFNVFAEFVISSDRIFFNDVAKLELVLPGDANGNVYVYRLEYNSTTNEDYEVVLLNETVTDGKYVHYFPTDNLVNYGRCYAKYTGSDYEVRYTTWEDNYEFDYTVLPKVTVPNKVWYKNKKPIIVEAPETATGNLTVTYWTEYNEIDTYDLYSGPIRGKLTIPTDDFDCGEYTVYLTYAGDDYGTASFSFTLTITDESPSVDIEPEQTADEIVKCGSDPYLFYDIIGIPYDADGYVLIYVDGKLMENNAVNSLHYADVSDLSVGEHTWKVEFKGDSFYKPASATGKFRLTYFNIDDVYPADSAIEVQLPEDAAGYVALTVDGKAYDVQYVKDGLVWINLNRLLAPGDHNYEIRYSGDGKYPAETKKGSFYVDAVFRMDVEKSFDYGEFTMEIYVPSDAKGSADIYIDDKLAGRAKVSNGHATFAKSDIPVGNHEIQVSYEDAKYSLHSTTEYFTIIGYYSIKSDDYGSMDYGEDKKITLTLPADAGGNLIVTINGVDQNPVPVTKGKAEFSLKDLNAGYYNISARYEGSYNVDNLYLGEEFGNGTYGEFCVCPKLIYPKIVYLGDNVTVSVKVQEGLSGNFVVEAREYGEGDFYNVVGTWNMTGATPTYTFYNVTPSNYVYAVKYIGEDASITAEEIYWDLDFKSDIPDESEVVGKSSMTISLPADATGVLHIKVNDYLFNMTVEVKDGKAVVPLTTLPSGDYFIAIDYTGNYGNFTCFKSFKIVNSPIDAIIKNIKFSGTTTSFDVVFSQNATGKVIVLVDNRAFERNIADGKVSISINNLAYGKHSVIVNYNGDEKYSQIIKQLSVSVPYPKITSKVASVVCNFGKYSVTVVGIDGKVVKGTNVVFKINGKKIGSAKTNAKGVASIVIKHAPKKYVIVAEALKVKLSKKVTVKSALTLKNVNVKKSAKKLVLTATLKNGKKAVAGKKLTFKFNGKKYVAKTNKKGIAKVTIKKAVLKKLKVGKKVTYQVSYLKNVVKKTVKVKK